MSPVTRQAVLSPPPGDEKNGALGIAGLDHSAPDTEPAVITGYRPSGTDR